MSLRNLLASLSALLILSACGSLPFLTGEVRMTPAELTSRLAKRFPMEKSVAGLLDVTLANPRVSLDEPRNRIVVTFDAVLKLPLTGKSMTGSLTVSGRPDYVPASKGIFLRDAEVERIRMDNMTDALAAALAKAATTAARDTLETRPVRAFTDEELSRLGLRYEPERLFVRGDQLVMTVR